MVFDSRHFVWKDVYLTILFLWLFLNFFFFSFQYPLLCPPVCSPPPLFNQTAQACSLRKVAYHTQSSTFPTPNPIFIRHPTSIAYIVPCNKELTFSWLSINQWTRKHDYGHKLPNPLLRQMPCGWTFMVFIISLNFSLALMKKRNYTQWKTERQVNSTGLLLYTLIEKVCRFPNTANWREHSAYNWFSSWILST